MPRLAFRKFIFLANLNQLNYDLQYQTGRKSFPWRAFAAHFLWHLLHLFATWVSSNLCQPVGRDPRFYFLVDYSFYGSLSPKFFRVPSRSVTLGHASACKNIQSV